MEMPVDEVARNRISSGLRMPALIKYPVFAVITLVFPEPAPWKLVVEQGRPMDSVWSH